MMQLPPLAPPFSPLQPPSAPCALSLTMADLIHRLQPEVTVPSGASAPPTMARTRRLRVYCSEGSWDSL